MADINDLRAQVNEITNRPDVTTLANAMLVRALRWAHFSSTYNFDLVAMDAIPYSGVSEFSIPLPDRFRQLHVIRSLNGFGNYGFSVRELSPEAALDDYVQMEKRNTYYIVGGSIQFAISDVYQNLRVEYFRLPTFEDSYIANNFAEFIIFKAASLVFLALKDNDSSKNWDQMASEMFPETVRSSFAI